ncbi:uncharacterized protein BDZ99DRAFT_219638 [Mytilinidion resinicola]|uniref:Uncharacterized protein n=1 Tax=Mytilinidion resinicola TaxID=574789 RepID=A0A6A6XYX8_9PEZI|nr:uncharacterized protein BDZ99DRAFT_219638 [Mytilinidion resinicola]KAF2801589.1 hypothetical protein BDZ99DRAFT_219638 [Mytilinidion resinicola]
MEGLDVFVGLMEGVNLGAASLAGFPSLKVLPFHGELGFHGVSVFQQESRNESMVVTLLDTDLRGKVTKAQEKLGRSIHIGYPFLQEAKVVKVSDELFDYVLPEQGPPQPVAIPHGPQEISNWKKKADRIENTYSRRLGMVIGDVESLVHVEMLLGLKKTEDGATIKEYGTIPGMETDYATQAIVDEVINEDRRFIEKAALPIEQEFPEGSRAFFLGDYAYGRPLEVISHADGKATVWVLTSKTPEREFGREIAYRSEQTTPYTPSFAVARMLNLNPLVLSKLTSSFSVQSSGLRLNLGLNLKFEAKKLKVLGYSRKGDTGWEYSQKAIDLIAQYMIKFPEFIAGIMRNPKGDIYEDKNFYPEEIAKEKMKEIGAWLKSIESKSFEKVPLEAAQLDSDVVGLIEKAADEALANGPPPEPKKLKGVPRSALLKPSDAEQRVGNQKFYLGDRVVYVQDSGRVPIGQRGTVVGLTRTSRTTLLDIVFDTTFMSGTTLGERCSPFRGSTVPMTSVLNLSEKQVIAWSPAGLAKNPQQAAQPLTMQQPRYGAPLGPGGYGQLVPAANPGPLRGSFRGAVAGHPNGSTRGGGRGGRGGFDNNLNGNSNGTPHTQTLPFNLRGGRGGGFAPRGQAGFVPRGRGGAANGRGFAPVDNTDPLEGVVQNNPNFKPKSYTNAPPPPQLDAPRGGRGRGGPRGDFRGGRGGRGPRGRGRGRLGENQPPQVQQQAQ